jgi:tetratricopeptide (TPR) repeat protein
MNKRLLVLEKMIESGSADSFARYAYALELKKEGRIDDALAAFWTLRQQDENYVPQYLMAGQMLIDANRKDEARQWLEPGLDVARAQGDTKASGEIETALADCD